VITRFVLDQCEYLEYPVNVTHCSCRRTNAEEVELRLRIKTKSPVLKMIKVSVLLNYWGTNECRLSI